MNGKNMRFNNIYVNATAVDAPYGDNWVQNTDGFGKYFDVLYDLFSLLTVIRYDGCRQCRIYQPSLSRRR